MWKPGEIPYSHYRETLIKLNILPLTYDREIKDLVFFYKSKYGSLDINVSEHVSFVRHGHTRLSVPLCKTKTYQASYFNRIVKLWNIISKEVSPRSFTSPMSFKRFLFAKYVKLFESTQRACILKYVFFLH